jgi:histidine phosphotransferase ChpT
MEALVLTERMPGSAGLSLSSLLCAHICHDLAGPLGAISAGADLLAEQPDRATAEMVGVCAAGAVAHLRFLRLALGPAGSPQPVAALRTLAEDYLNAGSSSGARAVQLDWHGGVEVVDGSAARLLLLFLLIGREALPRGGSIAIHLSPRPAPPALGLGLHLDCRGVGVALAPETELALSAGQMPTTPRAAPAWFAQQLAVGEGVVPRILAEPQRLEIVA